MDSRIPVNQVSLGTDHQPPQLLISPHMDPGLYKAASEGDFDAFDNNPNLDDLDLLLTPNNNTILHVYITSKTKAKITNDSKDLTQQNPSSRYLFLERVLHQCPSLLTKPNIKGETPLHIAARYGHYDLILVLANHVYARISLHDQDETEELSNFWRMVTNTKETALHEAARNNHRQVVELLLEKDPELVNMYNDAGDTPLYLAMERGYQEVSSMILQSCSSPAAFDGPIKRTVLHAAVIRNDAVMTEEILETTEGLTGRVDKEGWTPLHYASYSPSLELAKLLLKFDKSAAYIQDSYGRTPLLVAATPRRTFVDQRLSAEVMKLIISECPDCCELVDQSGRNVLHLAAESFNDPAMCALLQAPCLFNLINEKDIEGNTSFHVLANVGFNCNHLVRHRLLDSMAVNDRGFTALDTIQTAEYENLIDKIELWRNIVKVDKYSGSWRRELLMEPLDNVKGRTNKMIQHYREGANAHLVVAALIATVTFAAGFTLPGGLQNDDPKDPHDPIKKGYAVLSERFVFKVFLITDSITFLMSLSVILMHFLLAIQGNKMKVFWLCKMAFNILPFALFTMAVAFSTAIYVALPHSYTVGIANFIITGIAIVTGLIIMGTSLFRYQIKAADRIILGSFRNFLLMDGGRLSAMWDDFLKGDSRCRRSGCCSLFYKRLRFPPYRM